MVVIPGDHMLKVIWVLLVYSKLKGKVSVVGHGPITVLKTYVCIMYTYRKFYIET